jgi:hypothetical protein
MEKDHRESIDHQDAFLERRSEKRLADELELTISVLGPGRHLPKDKIIHTVCKDISPSGVRIRSHSFLPVDTPLTVKVLLKNPPGFISAFGKVRWIKSLFADEFFEMGLELFHAPG